MYNYKSNSDNSIAIFVGLLALLLAAMYFIDAAACTAKTKDIGFESRYSLFGGCQVEVNPNQWIPLESYYFKQE